MGTAYKVMAPEYLIASFLIAGRDKDITRTKILLEETKVDNKGLSGIMKNYELLEKCNKL